MARYDTRLFAFITQIRGFDKAAARAVEARAIEMTELHGVLDQPIDTLSKGYRRPAGATDCP